MKGSDGMSFNLREEIIKTATSLFMSQGYMATSTRQISKALNVSQPAIYHHFKNKEEIYVAVLTQFALEVGGHLHTILKKSQHPRDTLVEMATYLKIHHPMNLSLMMHDMNHLISQSTRQEIFKIWQNNYFAPFIHYFESIKEFIIPSFSITVVSQHFLRILSSYISETFKNDALSSVEIQDMVDIFLRGITDCKLSHDN